MPSVYLENQEITKELKRQKHELELKIKSLNKIRCDFYKKKFAKSYGPKFMKFLGTNIRN